jgi:hypothetical protein
MSVAAARRLVARPLAHRVALQWARRLPAESVAAWLIRGRRAFQALCLALWASSVGATGWSMVLDDGKQVSIANDGALDPSVQWLERRLPDGRPDLQFGRNGRVQFSLGADSAGPRGLAVDIRGRILVTGSAPGPQAKALPATLRFLADGRLDTSWGVQGRALAPAPLGSGFASEVAALGDGSVLLLGQVEDGQSENLALWLLLDDGSVDKRFGQDGLLPATGLSHAQGLSLHRDVDGSALIALQTLAQGQAWLEVHRWKPGTPHPLREARQLVPAGWQGPVHLARKFNTWQWFDAALPRGQGGMPLASAEPVATWLQGGASNASAPGASAQAPEAAASTTPGHAAFNPFTANERVTEDPLDRLMDELGWPAAVFVFAVALAGVMWWRRRY